jgi:hypothetical protein
VAQLLDHRDVARRDEARDREREQQRAHLEPGDEEDRHREERADEAAERRELRDPDVAGVEQRADARREQQ